MSEKRKGAYYYKGNWIESKPSEFHKMKNGAWVLDKEKFKEHQLNRREKELSLTDWIFQRHIEERELGKRPSLSEGEIVQVLDYRQSLRNITKTEDYEFPDRPSVLERIKQNAKNI